MSLIESSTAEEVLSGQRQSCDRYLVSDLPAGALLGVVDGVRRGEDAAHSAKMAVGAVNHSEARSLTSLLGRSEQRLQGTRGAVLRMPWFRPADDKISWVGAGNVAGVRLRKQSCGIARKQALFLRRAFSSDISAPVLRVNYGDTLIFSTDGIRSGSAEGLNLNGARKEIASTSSGTMSQT